MFCLFLFLLLSSSFQINAYIQLPSHIKPSQLTIWCHEKPPVENTIVDQKSFKRKIKGIVKMIRPDNLLPTLLLNVFGGFLINPTIAILFSSHFIVTTVNSLLFMCASMILNDVYDIKIDKINNPNRPLVTGEISRKESIIVSGILLLTVEVLSFHYLTPNLIWIMQLVMLKIFIYTPVLKKILFVKNISCAGLVSFTIFVSGLAAADSLLETNANVNLFYISTNLIFFGSLYNELLLDIHDMKGDLANNIKTIPVVFGKRVSLFLATLIIGFSVFSNTLSIAYLYRWSVGILLPILCTPIFIDLYKIQKDKFSNDSIMKSVKNSSKTLFLLLLYLGCIAFK